MPAVTSFWTASIVCSRLYGIMYSIGISIGSSISTSTVYKYTKRCVAYTKRNPSHVGRCEAYTKRNPCTKRNLHRTSSAEHTVSSVWYMI